METKKEFDLCKCTEFFFFTSIYIVCHVSVMYAEGFGIYQSYHLPTKAACTAFLDGASAFNENTLKALALTLVDSTVYHSLSQ